MHACPRLNVLQATQEPKFLSLEAEGCTSATDLAVSAENRHVYVHCDASPSPFVLEFKIDTEPLEVCLSVAASKKSESFVLSRSG